MRLATAIGVDAAVMVDPAAGVSYKTAIIADPVRRSMHRPAIMMDPAAGDNNETAREAEAAGLPPRPPTLSVADFFLDGFPDVLVPLFAPPDWAGGVDHGCEPGGRCHAYTVCEEIQTIEDFHSAYFFRKPAAPRPLEAVRFAFQVHRRLPSPSYHLRLS